MLNNYRIIIGAGLILLATQCFGQIVSTIFGDVEENNPLTVELLEHRCMQRLKFIDQSGPQIYFDDNFPKFSRYDHSLGVYALLKMYNAPIAEQIAGLLHDVSHTVFSHLADYVYMGGENPQDSYQDTNHAWFLRQIGAVDVLKKYALQLDDVSPKNPQYTALEQPLPDMNADRIEYNLHTAKVFGDLNQQEINAILKSLRYDNHKWYFTDMQNALKFAKLSTHYTRSFWGGEHNAALYVVSATAIRYALQHNILSPNDLQFGMDMDVVNTLQHNTDPVITQLVSLLQDIDKCYTRTDGDDYDVHFSVKMRGIDPLVLHEGQLQRLSKLSPDFAAEFAATKQYANAGVKLKFKAINDPKIRALLRQNFGTSKQKPRQQLAADAASL